MRLLKTLPILALTLLTPLAFADTFYFSGYASNSTNAPYTGINVVGSFNATEQSTSGIWNITSVTGYVGSNSANNQITMLATQPSNGSPITTAYGYIYDNLYFSSVSTAAAAAYSQATANGFDYYGLLFETAGGETINLFTNGGPVYADNSGAYSNNNYFDKVGQDNSDAGAPSVVEIGNSQVGSLAPTPEPSGLILLGTATLGLAFGVRRKMVANAA